jgi:acyl-[acyl-carrier-protein]-phospholipid O-acyltransferase/long-chain-fatty-acid--[acyl-carrier-protein] ligase
MNRSVPSPAEGSAAGVNPYQAPIPPDGPLSSDEATCAAVRHAEFDLLPSLYRDRSFWGMTTTQLLGAFNDSVFKQIVLLLCATVIVVPASSASLDKQYVALALFSVPFVLFSGIAGYWSDRVTKKWIIVGAKVGEIVVMLLAAVAFATMAPRVPHGNIFLTAGMPWFVLAVLFLMGTQSAIFGPAKYGVLPELFRGRDLPRCNGIVQMTTFLALILGTYVGGWLLDFFGPDLWKAGIVCVIIAAVGTATSTMIRRTPIAQRGAPFHISALAVAPDTWEMLRSDRALRNALWVYSAFWFVASIFPMAVNTLGLETYRLDYKATSFLLATVSVGIASGFVLAGKLSKDRVRFGLVRIGTCGLIVASLLLSLPRSLTPVLTDAGTREWPHLLGLYGSYVALAAVGFFAGFFALPVQVFLQSRPPDNLKGRMIGTMNLVNWIGIIFAAVAFYPLCMSLLQAFGLPNFAAFGVTAVVLVPVALFYHPRDANL